MAEIDLMSPVHSELLQKWGHVVEAVRPLNRWDTDLEIAWLCEAATRSRDVLELGVYNGASTKAMCLSNPDIRITFVDLWDDAGCEETFKAALAEEIKFCQVIGHKMSTEEFFKGDIRERYDLVFVDAGHLYHHVKGDIAGALTLMKHPSILAGHDFRHNLPDDGVTKAVTELLPMFYTPADSIWAVEI